MARAYVIVAAGRSGAGLEMTRALLAPCPEVGQRCADPACC